MFKKIYKNKNILKNKIFIFPKYLQLFLSDHVKFVKKNSQLHTIVNI